MTLKNTVIAGAFALASMTTFAQTKAAEPSASLLPAHVDGQLIPKDEEKVMLPLLFQVNKLTLLGNEYKTEVDAKTAEITKSFQPRYEPIVVSVNSQVAAIKTANGWNDDVTFDVKRQGFFKVVPEAKAATK